jgi:transmembrane sensor
MEHPRHGDERIAAEAADWFLRLRDKEIRPDRAAFAEWLTRSPVHLQEFLEVATLWSTVGMADSRDYDVDGLIAAARAEQAQRRVVQLAAPRGATEGRVPRGRARGVSVGIAASLLLGLGLWGGWALLRPSPELSTAVGEQRTITLSDGSVLFLNTNSAVRIRFGKQRRDIDLIRGEARFQVAGSPQRPFVVATTDATIRALGTVFNVAMDPEGTQVAVIEGRVELRERDASGAQSAADAGGSVDSHGNAAAVRVKRHARIELAAGQRAAVTNNGIEPDVGPSLESVNAWTQHRLVFRDRTLAEVIGEFNRYRAQQLVIDDPELAGLRISGSFDPSDPDSLVAYLGAVEAVQAITPADGNVHLSRGHK